MEIVLIACCDRKAAGGSTDYPGSEIEKSLDHSTFQQLLSLRRELCRIIRDDEIPGPDLGGVATMPIKYFPAYERYDGIVYRSGCIGELIASAKDIRIFIVSALYGLLDANDPIRYYNHAMSDTIPGIGRLKTWWKRKNLGGIVEKALLQHNPNKIHDLLTQDYREALKPWPGAGFIQKGVTFIQYDFPGIGLGGLYRRGEIVEKLLTGR